MVMASLQVPTTKTKAPKTEELSDMLEPQDDIGDVMEGVDDGCRAG